jgi:hypothetical protein
MNKQSRHVNEFMKLHNISTSAKKTHDDDGSDDDNCGNNQSPSGVPDVTHFLQSYAKKQGVFRDNNHIYFRCCVNMKNVNALCNILEEYNREHDLACIVTTTSLVIPKPVYLHITSDGGSVNAGFLACKFY